MTNTEMMAEITGLNKKIKEYNISDFDNFDEISNIIDKFKKLQKKLMYNNFNNLCVFRNEEMKIFDLIKIKESIIMKRNILSETINNGLDDDMEKTLSAYQSLQEYTKALSEIHFILDNINNKEFE